MPYSIAKALGLNLTKVHGRCYSMDAEQVPFELVYGTEANLPLPLELAMRKLRIVIEDNIYKDGLEKKIWYLGKLEEEREEIIDHITQQ